MLFAEGTRSSDGRLQPFKKGPFVLAIEGEVPLVPVWITADYAEGILQDRSRKHRGAHREAHLRDRLGAL